MVRLRRNDFCVDVLELRVAVGMVRAFVRLAIELARKAEFDQFLAHSVGADPMAHRRQRFSEFVHALGDPCQRSHGIAQGRGFDEPRKFGNEAGINLRDSPTPAPGAANLALGKRFPIQVVIAAIDRRARKTRNPRHYGQTAPPGGSHLGRRKQPPPAFVELAPNGVPAISNRVFVDHAPRVRLFVEIRNPSKTHSDPPPKQARFGYCSKCPKTGLPANVEKHFERIMDRGAVHKALKDEGL